MNFSKSKLNSPPPLPLTKPKQIPLASLSNITLNSSSNRQENSILSFLQNSSNLSNQNSSRHLALLSNDSRNCYPSSTDVHFTPQYTTGLTQYMTPFELGSSIARINHAFKLPEKKTIVLVSLKISIPLLIAGGILGLITQLPAGGFPYSLFILLFLSCCMYAVLHIYSKRTHSILRQQFKQSLAVETAIYASEGRKRNNFQLCRFRMIEKVQTKSKDLFRSLFRKEEYSFLIEELRNDQILLNISTPTQTPYGSSSNSRDVSIRIEAPRFTYLDRKPPPVDNRFRGATTNS